jgi:hypothetical protein
MATLIPAIDSGVSRMTSGESRLAERLEQKLDDDYLLWYDVPVAIVDYAFPRTINSQIRRTNLEHYGLFA